MSSDLSQRISIRPNPRLCILPTADMIRRQWLRVSRLLKMSSWSHLRQDNLGACWIMKPPAPDLTPAEYNGAWKFAWQRNIPDSSMHTRVRECSVHLLGQYSSFRRLTLTYSHSIMLGPKLVAPTSSLSKMAEGSGGWDETRPRVRKWECVIGHQKWKGKTRLVENIYKLDIW